MELYREYEMEINEINKLQKGKTFIIILILYKTSSSLEQQKLRENIQQYEHKRNENEMVKSEFNFIESSDTVFKLIGPILVKQETSEAKLNIEKRLEFINKEMYILYKLKFIVLVMKTNIKNKRPLSKIRERKFMPSKIKLSKLESICNNNNSSKFKIF